MNKNLKTQIFVFLLLLLLFSLYSCNDKIKIELVAQSKEVEVNKSLPISLKYEGPELLIPVEITWKVQNGGKIEKTNILGEVNFIAPSKTGTSTIIATIKIKDKTITKKLDIKILPEGALKKTATIIIEVDTNTLKNVWVNKEHPSEKFTPPLKIKGTFTYDPDTEHAEAGGNWPTYNMYDDGTHGDKVANDGIWTIRMIFDKTDSKVYFAFDDASPYRVEWESGVTWRLKIAWIDLDEFPDDHSNPAFIPDKDKTLIWDKSMAEKGKIYEPLK